MSFNPLSQEAIEWGCTILPATVMAGKPYWKIVEAAGPENLGGNHHLYCDLWDEAGNRVVGVQVMFYSTTEQWIAVTEAKTGEKFSVNMPMFAGGNAYGVRVDDGTPSDSFFGAGLVPFEEHKCFQVIFRRQTADGSTIGEPPAPPPPLTLPPAMSAAAHIDEAIRHMQLAKELL